MENKICVLMSVYKNDKLEWLVKSVDSILSQTYSNLMLYMGVDGAVDDDVKVYLDTLCQDIRVVGIHYTVNRGLTAVLNDLLEETTQKGYEFFARMDADDISLPNRFQLQMDYLLLHPNIDVVGGFTSRINSSGNLLNRIIKLPEQPEDCKKIFAYRNPLAHPAVLFRKSFFEKVGHFYRPDFRTNQDTILWYDGLMNGAKIANVQEIVLFFRVSDDLISARRGGKEKAQKQLKDRLIINKDLGYGLKANLYAYGVYLYMIAPIWIKRRIYKLFR